MQDHAPNTPVYASFLARAGAFLLDWAIVLIIAMFVAGSITADERTRVAVSLVAFCVYHIAFLIAVSTTPGKMALRLHVTGPDNRRLEPDRAILRFLVFFLSVLTVICIPISAALVLLDPQRRSFHDRVARTHVLSGRQDYEGTRHS